MHVLLVDDELFFRELYADYLGRIEGCTVESFGDAAAALERFERGGVDLVISDLVMPGMDGLALVAALRDRQADLPIVVVTQREDVRAAVEALRQGVNEYLIKPVDREMLQMAVHRAIEVAGLKRDHRRLQEENLEYLKSERLYRACLQLVDEVDLLRLQEEMLEHLLRLCGAQGAALWAGTGEGKRPFELAAFRGVVSRDSVPSSWDLREDNPISNRLRDRAPHVDGNGGLWVPLVSGSQPMGVAMVVDKLAGEFEQDDVMRAMTLADFSAVALRNALRFAHLQRAGLRDRDTSAYNLTYFIDYAGKEIYKARRYARAFSLVSIQVDNLSVMRRALPGDTTRTIHRALINAARNVIRDSDILAKVTDDTFYLLLPETDYFGARMFARRALKGFAAEPVIERLTVPPSVVVGCATFPKDGEDFDELIHHCRLRQDEVRHSPYRRLRLETHPFWELLDTLLTSPLKGVVAGDAGRRGPIPEALLDSLLREAARRVEREHHARGLVYYGAEEVHPELPLLAQLSPVRETAARVYLLGRSVIGGIDHPNVTPVQLPDETRLDGCRFFIYLTEHAHYAWLQRGAEVYHTSDPPLVEAIVARLQEQYDLQRHY